jgi:hypothetical protein
MDYQGAGAPFHEQPRHCERSEAIHETDKIIK